MNKAYYFLAFAILVILGVGIYFHFNRGSVEVKNEEVLGSFAGLFSTIEWNGEPLIDRTTYVGDKCYGEYLGMRVEVIPCNAKKWSNSEIIQNVNFTWKGASQINITWIFVYEGKLDSGGIDLAKYGYYNTTEEGTHSQWVNNYLITDIINYTNLGTPDVRCQFGNTNNTQMYEVNRINVTHGFNKQTWCFSTVTPINASAFYLSGNIDAGYQYLLQHQGWFWDDVTSAIVYLGYGLLGDNRSYYQVNEVGFNPQQSYYTRWRFTPENSADKGKWHIIGYEKEYGLVDSLNDNRYLYLDPSWDAADLGNRLLGYWTFNETTGQWASESSTGWMNITTNATIANGKDGKARDFTTPNKGFFVPAAGKNMFQSNWTVNFWMNKTNYNFGEFVSGNGAWLIGTKSTDNAITVYSSGPNNCVSGWCNANVTYPTDGQFVMATFVHNVHTNRLDIYQNGVLRGNHTTFIDASGTVNLAQAQIVGYFPGVIDEFAVWNRTLAVADIQNLYNSGNGFFYGFPTVPPGSFAVEQNYPANNFLTNQPNVWLSANITIYDRNTTNETFYVWGRYNETFTYTNTTYNNFTAYHWYNFILPADGVYTWNTRVCSINSSEGDINCTFAPSNWTFTFHSVPPTVTINVPANNSLIYGANASKVNVSFNVTNFDTLALSLCWAENDTGNTTYGCGTNYSQYYSQGTHTIKFYANDTANNIASSQTTFTVLGYFYSQANKNQTWETDTVNFSTNFTFPTSFFTAVTPLLHYEATDYSATNTSYDDNPLIYRLHDQPLTYANASYYWAIGLTNLSGQTSYYNSTNYSIIRNVLTFGACSATNNIVYMNLSFVDEETGDPVNATSTSFTGKYYLGSGTVTKSFSYANNTGGTSYIFCLNAVDRTMNFINGSITYAATGYPSRTWNSFNPTYNNGSTVHTLKLLASASGGYVTFQVITQGQNTVENALVTISVSGAVIESKLTDAAGSATFFMNPLTSYSVTVSKSGYQTTTVTIFPTQTQYTITLVPTGSSINSADLLRGLQFTTGPIGDELMNGTNYTFNFTISSLYYPIDYFGFTLTNGSMVIGSAYAAANGGTVSTNLNTGNNKTIHMNYYWSSNGTVFNASTSSFRIWTVDSDFGKGFGLTTFLQDLKNYSESGMFGLDGKSMAIIIFLAIFLLAGGLCYKYGFTSPMAVMLFVFAVVGIFDSILGLIPSPSPLAPRGIPTAMAFAILLGTMIWEAYR